MKIELWRKARSGYALSEADVQVIRSGELVEVKVRGGNTLRFSAGGQVLLAAALADAATQRAGAAR